MTDYLTEECLKLLECGRIIQNGTPLQELMELGQCYVMVLRYAHLAADHLQGAACRIDATFLLHTKSPQQVRAA